MVDDLISVSEASRRLGVSRFGVDRIIKREGLQEFESRLDRRVRLLKAADIERLQRQAITPRQAPNVTAGVAA